MIVREKEIFRSKMMPLPEWEIKLQEDFPFMEQDPADDNNTYRKWGFECGRGWAKLLRDCCEAITARYAEDNIGLKDIDFEPVQIKEKWGTLRFYYGYTDAPCGIAAFDNLATGESIRFEPKSEGEIGEAKAKLRQDIRTIVSAAEKKSAYTCEICGTQDENGETVKLRNGGRVRTLCDKCHEEQEAKIAEKRKQREEMKKPPAEG